MSGGSRSQGLLGSIPDSGPALATKPNAWALPSPCLLAEEQYRVNAPERQKPQTLPACTGFVAEGNADSYILARPAIR